MSRKYWLAAIIALTLTTGLALAGSNMPGEHRQRLEPPKTRQEAITRAKESLARLEKMTDQEWTERQKRREARRKPRGAQRMHQGGMPELAAPAAAPAVAQPPAAAPAAKPVRQ